MPGVASCPRGPFWSPHCQEIGGGGSDLHRQWRALTGRAGNLRILCDQLEHTEVNLKQLEEELRHAKEAVKPGQPLDVIVLSVDAAQRRVSLGRADRDGDSGGDEGGAPMPSAPAKLGTFADLLNKKKK